MAQRSKNYTCIVYPDSAPADWLEKIQDLKVQVCISPLHDSDFTPDGEIKKSHYHVVLMYDGVKTREQAKVDCLSFGGVVPPPPKSGSRDDFIVSSLRVMLRYLCHLDNPDKHLYSSDDVITFGGFDYGSHIVYDDDGYKIIEDICSYCETNHIQSFYRLVMFARYNRHIWVKYLVNNAFFFKTFLQSAFWSEEKPPLGFCPTAESFD